MGRGTENPAGGVDGARKGFPYYRKLDDSARQSHSPLFAIHPESSLYASAVVARCPPSAVLFLEAVDGSPDPTDGDSDSDSTHQRVMMRYCCGIPTSWLSDRSEEIAAGVAATATDSDGLEDVQIEAHCDATSSLSSSENQLRKKRKANKLRKEALPKRRRLSDNGSAEVTSEATDLN